MQSLYTSINKKLGKWESQFGLRMENTQTKGSSLTLKETYKKDYLKLFPTFYLQYIPNSKHNFSFNYSRRISRPYFTSLNPFVRYINPYSTSEGNPFLKPSYSHNFEVSYTFKDNWNNTLYLSKSKDIDDQIESISEGNIITKTKMMNAYDLLTIGLSESYTFKRWKLLQSVNSFHVYYNKVTSLFPEHISDYDGVSASFYTNNISILQKFKTEEISLETSFCWENEEGCEMTKVSYGEGRSMVTKECTFENCLSVNFGELIGIKQLHQYLQKKDEEGRYIFLSDSFRLPSYKPNQKFNFNLLEDALDIAILYEESYGNKQIRDYCSSMITRFKSLQERDDYKFLKSDVEDISYNNYRNKLLGIYENENIEGYRYSKRSQITIIDLNSAEDEIVEVISCVISRIIYEAIKYIEPRNIFPVNLILEEAHRYISINQERLFLRANHIFERIAKEGRKYGMFLMVSSQRPSELSKTVLSQCSNFIVHRIQTPEDLSHIKQITPHISDAILKRLPSIPTQQALIFGHAVNLPAMFKVNKAQNLYPKAIIIILVKIGLLKKTEYLILNLINHNVFLTL